MHMKYLFVLDKYYPKPLANAVCCQNIIDVLTSNGNEVDVLCFEDSEEKIESYKGCKVYHVKPNSKLKNEYKADHFSGTKLEKKYFRRMKFHSLSRKLFTFNYEPFYSFSFPRRIRKMIEEIVKNNGIECIITSFQPFDGVYAMYKARKKNKLQEIPWIVYTLDNVDNVKLRKLLKLRSSHNYWSKKFLKYCDGFIYMESRKKDYQIKKFDAYRDKLYESDLPTLITREKLEDLSSNNKNDTWTYLGSMDMAHYNPSFALEFLSKSEYFKNNEFHFYSRGTGVDLLNKKSKEYPNSIFVHDYVSREEVEKILKATTGFISIKVTPYISAKIFEYISTGKPIIHFSSVENDPNATILEKYPKALIVKESKYRAGEYTVEDFKKDIDRIKNAKIESSTIEKIFRMNKPEFTAKLIEELASKKNKSLSK